MAPSFLTGGNNNAVKFFNIRVDEDHLIFRGNADEAAPALLKGTLVLCTSEPLRVQDIQLQFVGEARTSCVVAMASSTRVPKQETEFFKKKWSFDNQNEDKKHANTLPPGNHEWPFELVLQGDLPESVEGMSLSWIVYRMKAVLDRGLLAKNLEARKHIRIIRTFDSSSLELSHAMAVDNVWPDKLQYNISTPSKGVVFGTSVRIDFELIPLLKGLRFGKIEIKVLETSEVTVQSREFDRSKKEEREVASNLYDMEEDDMETEDIHGQDGYRFSRHVALPRNLRECVQSVEEKNILVKHHVKFIVALLNPDGHISELRAILPLQIFISPNLRISESNEITGPAPNPDEPLEEFSNLAPPGYGDHQLDPLYDGVDPRGFITPGHGTPFDRSRRGSVDDLSASALASSELSANTLHNRLNNLAIPVSSRFPRIALSGSPTPSLDGPSRGPSVARADSSPQHDGSGASWRAALTPGTSSGTQTPATLTPQHLEYNQDELARVPSYNTAIHTPARTPYSKDLPGYFDATAGPPTPPQGARAGSARGSVAGESREGGGGASTPGGRRVHYS